jgi:hypothetical protein
MSCFCHTTASSGQQVRTKFERVKVLKVIGEAIAQVVAEGNISIHAVKIDRIIAEIKDVTDHIFHNKVIKQGTIHKQIFYVDREGIVRETEENIPFIVSVDIPGLKKTPFIDVQNHLLDINTDFVLTPGSCHEPGILMQKVVAHILVKVSEWTELDVVTKVDFFPKINSLTRIVSSN